MARYSRLQVAQTMHKTGMVPLFYNPDPELVKKFVTACYRGGARIFEFTNRGDLAHEVFRELIAYANKELPGMIIGVGSVADVGTTSLYLQMGANFIVTPSLREDIALTCNRRKVLWAPGCGSLTEIGRAEELGCEVVKLFPGNVYGPGFVKAIRGPQPWTNIMPTGGVSPDKENLESWFNAGAYCVGMGSKLAVKNENGQLDFMAIEALTASALEIIRNLRTK